MSIKLIIIDDHPVVRTGIAGMLEGQDSMKKLDGKETEGEGMQFCLRCIHVPVDEVKHSRC